MFAGVVHVKGRPNLMVAGVVHVKGCRSWSKKYFGWYSWFHIVGTGYLVYAIHQEVARCAAIVCYVVARLVGRVVEAARQLEIGVWRQGLGIRSLCRACLQTGSGPPACSNLYDMGCRNLGK